MIMASSGSLSFFGLSAGRENLVPGGGEDGSRRRNSEVYMDQ